jgi:hypothetical protein
VICHRLEKKEDARDGKIEGKGRSDHVGGEREHVDPVFFPLALLFVLSKESTSEYNSITLQ